MKKPQETPQGYARATGERTVELVHRSPVDREVGQAAFTSSSGRGRTRQEMRTWNCAARREIRNRDRAESGLPGVSTRWTDTVAQRGPGYYCEPARARRPGETTSPKGSSCEAERESGRRVRGVGECGKVRKTS
jgi:hypothetical protein